MKKTFLGFIFFILLITVALSAKLEFKLFGAPWCEYCAEEKMILTETFPEASIQFFDLTSTDTAKEFEVIYQQVFPTKQERYYPLTIGIKDNKIFAVAVGAQNEEFWKEALNRKKVTIKFMEEEERFIENIEIHDVSFFKPKSLGEIFAICITSAFLDAINPCAINVLLVFLTLMVVNIDSKKKIIQSGLSFTFATFVVYYLLGLGLITVIKSLWWIKYPLYIFAGWIGFMEILNGFKGKDWSPIPKRWKSSVEKGMKTILSPLGALIIGLFVGVVLLPCTSGPYIVALSALSGIEGFMKFFILTLYNLIFVSPFIVLTFLVPFGLSTMRLKKMKKTSTEIMEIVTGGALLTLVIVSLIFGF